ncbi:MAG: hypothetical protein AUJ58_06190 [Zetaproteobacteria bacterium CG1_02_55_237]|nr:MAG: hypothetical protein AUJ58_06190 [Zetaproteobacteria bacterium CG1_02_55_237]
MIAAGWGKIKAKAAAPASKEVVRMVAIWAASERLITEIMFGQGLTVRIMTHLGKKDADSQSRLKLILRDF